MTGGFNGISPIKAAVLEWHVQEVPLSRPAEVLESQLHSQISSHLSTASPLYTQIKGISLVWAIKPSCRRKHLDDLSAKPVTKHAKSN